MNILFVCTGNTCRSCVAEAIFNNICDLEAVTAKSAGLSVVPNSKTSANSASLVLKHFNQDISDRNSIQINEDLVKQSDLILTMTGYMKDVLRKYYTNYANKVFTLNEYVGVKGDIMDPYGGNISVYEKTFFELKHRIELLIAKLKEDRSI